MHFVPNSGLNLRALSKFFFDFYNTSCYYVVYVKAKHIWANQINNCCWWLRSPNYGSKLFSHYVNAGGVSGCNADKAINCNLSYITPHGDGIVPALTISLP